MKRLILTLLLFVMSLSVSATEVTDFLSRTYPNATIFPVKIVSKAEHVECYQQKIGDDIFPYIAYGYGYLKIKTCRKKTISYICLLNCDCKPIWGYVIPR